MAGLSALSLFLIFVFQNCGGQDRKRKVSSKAIICPMLAPPSFFRNGVEILDPWETIEIVVGETVQFGVGEFEGATQIPCGGSPDEQFWTFESQSSQNYCLSHTFNTPGSFELEWQYAFGYFGCTGGDIVEPPPQAYSVKLNILVQ
jgi:hypothetical protein